MESGQIRRPSEAVLAALPDPVVVVEGGAVAWHNAAARELFGLPAAGLDGREWRAVLGEEHEEALLDAQDRARGADEAVRLSLRRRGAAGADLSLDVAVIADGPRLVHVLRDATAAEAARAGLLAEKRRTDAILAAIDEVIYTDLYLPDGSVEFVHVGPGWERLLGNPPAGLTFDEAWDGAIHPDDDERCAEADDRLRQGEPIEFELRLACYDGVTRTILDRARPTRLSDGSVVVNGVLSDITGRKETEERLREALALAETALRETQSARAELERLSRVDVLTEPRQPPPLRRRAHVRAGARPPRGRVDGPADRRPRPLQADQRQLRAPGRRRGAARVRAPHQRGDARLRHGGALGRRGVRRPAAAHPQRRGAARGAPSACARRSSREPLPVGGELLETTASVGAARTTSRLGTADGLLEAADQALYAAKRRGRNRVRIASELTRRDSRRQPLAVRLAEMLASRWPSARASASPTRARWPIWRAASHSASTCRARRCCAAGWAGCCTTSARSRCRTRVLRSPGR